MRAVLIVIALSALCYGCGEGNTDLEAEDPSSMNKLVQAGRSHLTDQPKWFIPPEDTVFGGGDGSLQNISGAVAWADNELIGYYGGHENTSSFYDKINKATVQYQTNWDQYQDVVDGGYPGGEPPYQAGFVCWALVYQAANSAGISIPLNYNCNSYSINFSEVPDGQVQVGDIVLYDWWNQDTYEHMGIITDVSAGTWPEDEYDYYVVQSIGLVEHFSYGAAERRLGIFGLQENGGDFINWVALWNDWDYKIVRIQ